MSLHSWPLQQAIFTKLNAANITDYASNAITGVFDDVPEETLDAHEHTLTIHVWSQYRGGFRDVKVIMQQIFTALHNGDITVSGASLVNIRHEFETVLLEQDGITRHGVMRFRVVVFDS